MVDKIHNYLFKEDGEDNNVLVPNKDTKTENINNVSQQSQPRGQRSQESRHASAHSQVQGSLRNLVSGVEVNTTNITVSSKTLSAIIVIRLVIFWRNVCQELLIMINQQRDSLMSEKNPAIE